MQSIMLVMQVEEFCGYGESRPRVEQVISGPLRTALRKAEGEGPKKVRKLLSRWWALQNSNL